MLRWEQPPRRHLAEAPVRVLHQLRSSAEFRNHADICKLDTDRRAEETRREPIAKQLRSPEHASRKRDRWRTSRYHLQSVLLAAVPLAPGSGTSVNHLRPR